VSHGTGNPRRPYRGRSWRGGCPNIYVD
jgi:hypothetical protein